MRVVLICSLSITVSIKNSTIQKRHPRKYILKFKTTENTLDVSEISTKCQILKIEIYYEA